MNNILRLKNILLSMLVVLAFVFANLSLTACSNDDDNKEKDTPATQTVEIDGRKISVAAAKAFHSEVNHYWYVILDDANGDLIAEVTISDYYLGKSKRLADGQSDTSGDAKNYEVVYTGIRLLSLNNKENYWCEEGDFKSGTLKVMTDESAQTVTVKAEGVTKDNHSFAVSYSGVYWKVDFDEE